MNNLKSRLDNDYTMYAPREIQDMAMKIEDYFNSHKTEKWVVMNICSRNHIDDIKSLREKLENIKKELEKL